LLSSDTVVVKAANAGVAETMGTDDSGAILAGMMVEWPHHSKFWRELLESAKDVGIATLAILAAIATPKISFDTFAMISLLRGCY
jgi:hypothetical protein